MSRLSNYPPGVSERDIPGVDDDDGPTCAECGEVLSFDRVNDHSFCAECESLSCDGCNTYIANGHGHYPEGHYGPRVCDGCIEHYAAE